MKKLTALLFALMLAVTMTMPAFGAGQSMGDSAPASGQTTHKKHKKKHKKNKTTTKKHHKRGTSGTTPPPQ